jgi:hypothetical protein
MAGNERPILYTVHGVYTDNARLFHDEIIPDECDPFNAPCYLTCLIDSILRSNHATQMDGALVSFDTDLE